MFEIAPARLPHHAEIEKLPPALGALIGGRWAVNLYDETGFLLSVGFAYTERRAHRLAHVLAKRHCAYEECRAAALDAPVPPRTIVRFAESH